MQTAKPTRPAAVLRAAHHGPGRPSSGRRRGRARAASAPSATPSCGSCCRRWTAHAASRSSARARSSRQAATG